MSRNLNLRQRILLGFVVPFLLLLSVMVLVYYQALVAEEKSTLLNETAAFSSDVLGAADSLVRAQRASYAYLLMNGQTLGVGGYPKEIFNNSVQRFHSKLDKLDEVKMLTGQHEELHRLVDIGNKIIEVNKGYMDLIDQGQESQAIAQFRLGESVKLAKMIDSTADAMVAKEQAARLTFREDVTKDVIGVRSTVLIGTGTAMVLTVLLGLWIAKLVARQITANASQLSTVTNEIAATIAQHEQTASQQAAAASETSVTIEELSVSSRKSAEQAANAATLADKSGVATAEGVETSRQVAKAMGSLKERIDTMAERTVHLSEQTGQIGEIAMLVKDLSAQINMLALNAAVEAARAGEHGKGFAVVASEVRSLAVESRKSAEQANQLVAEVQKAANTSVMMTEESVHTVADAMQLAGKAATLFESLAMMASNVNENAQQVMLNAKQQSTAFAQIAEAINGIAMGTKETAAGITQTKIGVQELNKSAENLKAIA